MFWVFKGFPKRLWIDFELLRAKAKLNVNELNLVLDRWIPEINESLKYLFIKVAEKSLPRRERETWRSEQCLLNHFGNAFKIPNIKKQEMENSISKVTQFWLLRKHKQQYLHVEISLSHQPVSQAIDKALYSWSI